MVRGHTHLRSIAIASLVGAVVACGDGATPPTPPNLEDYGLVFSRVERALTNDSRVHLYPQWSPDGRRIVYVANGGTGLTDWDVWVMNADGSGQTR
jgi:hypothetical protein